MATRKQKHERALAKREAFLAEHRRTGLAAQQDAHEREERRRARLAEQEAERLAAEAAEQRRQGNAKAANAIRGAR